MNVRSKRCVAWLFNIGIAAAAIACNAPARPEAAGPSDRGRQLPTGLRLDPVGETSVLGSMPLSIALAPGGARAVVLLGGWREQGIQVIETATGRIAQTLLQPAAFVGVTFSPDGHDLYVSGGDDDIIYRYEWRGDSATLKDSLPLGPRPRRAAGARYPAGLAISRDGRMLYVAENLGDSVAVVDIASRRVVQRLATGRYPYGVAIAPDGTVYVSAWGASTVSAFTPRGDGQLSEGHALRVARHPSALLLNADGSRLFVASGSTDRVVVVDTKSHAIIAELNDAPPGSPGEGSTQCARADCRWNDAVCGRGGQQCDCRVLAERGDGGHHERHDDWRPAHGPRSRRLVSHRHCAYRQSPPRHQRQGSRHWTESRWSYADEAERPGIALVHARPDNRHTLTNFIVRIFNGIAGATLGARGTAQPVG